LNYREVVTSFLTTDHRVLLLRRSQNVGTHREQWSAVSGYLEGDEQPLTRAKTEIREEVGLSDDQINLLREGEVLRAFDEGIDTVWVIHPFLFEAKSSTVQLDWENSEYRWIEPKQLASYETVPELREAFDRVSHDFQATPEALTQVLHGVEGMSRDRVHGASFLGRQALELLSTAAQASDAKDTDALFYHLLLVFLRLRRAQPAMANVWNLTGELLQAVDREMGTVASVDEFKIRVKELGQRIGEEAAAASEDASRNTAQILPQDGVVLTHSYSSTVLRSLELGFKGGKAFQVFATESYPGMEGKQLAKDLIALGISVRLVADSAVHSIIPRANLVLVGADSVLKDGSLIHKTGTGNIATAAKKYGISFCSSCETAKFSTQDFLGEHPTIPQDLFDLTPAESVSNYITEYGQVEPVGVEKLMRNMSKEIYS
jgi:translation initiation factor 2B subunit (eIF-2B alpha/beta/delta family)/8-oxo-dGTP pyrophosphatase MutT (NUDIX family)